MKRAAIYARYSSDLQSPTSIDDQRALCHAYAARQGWTVAATFTDADRHGSSTAHRSGYQQLLVEAYRTPPPFDIVLVEDLSRLTRKTAETMTLCERMSLKGIVVIGVSDGIDSSQKNAKLQIGFRGLVNEMYLDDLGEKTHRGLAGSVARGLSTGGKTFGYRAVPAPVAAQRAKDSAPAVIEINPPEADVVRRIFQDYRDGRSMKDIVFALNAAGAPFPGHDTRRGPARRGWAVSSIHTILHNEKYTGTWVWNKTKFVKNPDTGRRMRRDRPPEEWVAQDRPELGIVDAVLWQAVQARLAAMADRFGQRPRGRPGGAAHVAYSPRLLAGLLRCGACGARMHAVTFTRKKGTTTYTYRWYVCGFAKDKGPQVCQHRVWYRADWLEDAIIARFREATTPAMLQAVVEIINATLTTSGQGADAGAQHIQADVLRLEREAANLVRFLRDGQDSPTVRAELEATETALQGLREDRTRLQGLVGQPIPQVQLSWVQAKLQHLDDLLRQDPVGAKLEFMKHLEGDLTISPLPAVTGQRRAEITGCAKANSLLADQEAACVRLVAGARFELATFGL